MGDSELISIITVTLNRKNSLEKAINSILSQSYKNFELIIVDGYSEDKTWKYLNEIKDARVKIFRLEKKGVFHAMNYALEKTSGAYVAFLNDDDWYESNFLELAISNLENSNADWVFGNNTFHFPDGGEWFIKADKNYYKKPWIDFIRFHHTTCLFKIECFEINGLYKTHIIRNNKVYRLYFASDYLWFLEAIRNGLQGKYVESITGHMSWGGLSTVGNRTLLKEGYQIALNVYPRQMGIHGNWLPRIYSSLKMVLLVYGKIPEKVRRKIWEKAIIFK
jgi:glycosyltransferase involved in cell wall biosynthesis